jgi:1-deoxy-D-xylulose-5-phosphate reductoisomerase
VTGVAVVGSTGSIGRAALDVVRRLGGTHRVVGLSASTRWETLLGQAREFRPLRVAIADEQAASRLRAAIEADGSARGLRRRPRSPPCRRPTSS